MKKYGDDADLVHDQGTRVEASRRVYEQNRIRYNYSRNQPKPRYSYNSKYSNESTFKRNWSCAPDYDKDYYERINIDIKMIEI